MPEIVNLPKTKRTPTRRRGGTAPQALTVADMLTMTPGEVAAFVHDHVTMAVPDDDDGPARPQGLGDQPHIAYQRAEPYRAEHARRLSMWARRRVGVGEFGGYFHGVT